jgi:GT2 family glycosyltransferase
MEDYDLPAYNLFIRREVLNEIGGWGSKYYGGEDTKVCLEMKKRGYKLLYTPEIIAWHHRRPFPIKHLKQIGNVGRQRGMFARKYPETSRKLFYFLPSIGSLLFLAFLLISLFNGNVASVFLKILALCYLLIFSVSLIERKNLLISLSLPFVIFFSHLIYGLRFLKGFLFMKNEKD